jgi:hypothetical protein
MLTTDIQKLKKIEFNDELKFMVQLNFINAELVINRETKTWDIDLRGARNCNFDYQDKVYLIIHLENGGIFKGRAFVNISPVSNENFHLQGITELTKLSQEDI